MLQWRVVYEYKRDTIRGAGAAFVIAPNEASAREQLERAMPGVTVLELKVEPEDPRAVYERPHMQFTTRCLRSLVPAPNGDCWCATCSAVRALAQVML